MTKQEAKEKIEKLEYYANGMQNIVAGVNAVNILVRKKEKKVIADIILWFEDKEERYNDCEYSFGTLAKVK